MVVVVVVARVVPVTFPATCVDGVGADVVVIFC